MAKHLEGKKGGKRMLTKLKSVSPSKKLKAKRRAKRRGR